MVQEEPFPAYSAEHQHGSTGLDSLPSPPANANGTGPSHNDGEEPYTIRCICGFEDDDGNTVLCEQCETWQHIECYYYPHLTVPDIHKCSNCFPRPLDASSAIQRQKRRLREGINSNEDRKAKRNAPKTHRRSKPKDSSSFAAHQVNGASTNERASRSPRDEPPPSKRAKIGHKSSKSISATNNNHNHRNLGASAPVSLQSPNKPALADCPPDYFSPEFIRVHRENTEFSPAQANLFLNIGISDLLSTWLDDPHAFALATNGKSHADVFKLQPSPIEELETPVKKHVREDPSVQFHGANPRWPYLVADRDILEGHFVGELIGSIGHVNDYKGDPENDWDRLRHPSHFVFFHPHLPIYIDCRSEGTVLRYARHSCRPNVKIETLVTGARDLHFCFIATTDIPQGAEITLAWDVESDPRMRDHLSRISSSLDDIHREYITRFISTVLAHFGDCACEHTYDDSCLIGRWDRRLENFKQRPLAENPPNRRHTPTRTTPSRMHRGANSRDASETVPPGNEVEMGEGVSSPQSSRSRNSREPSPPLYDRPLQIGPGLSERDKRKLLQSEKLFQKMDIEQDQKKKKRQSGSQANTPTAGSMQLGRSYFPISDADTSVPSSRPRMTNNGQSYSTSPGLRSSAENSPRAQSPLDVARLVSFGAVSKPVYTDAASQTDDTWNSKSNFASPTLAEKKPYISLSQRLLRRNHLAQKWSQREPTESLNSLNITSPNSLQSDLEAGRPGKLVIETDISPTTVFNPVHQILGKELEYSTTMDIAAQSSQSGTIDELKEPRAGGGVLTEVDDTSLKRNNFRDTNFRLNLPSQHFVRLSESGPSTVGAAASLSGPAGLSPQALGSSPPMTAPIASMGQPLMTPTQSTTAQPSPAKKKMSLSDYSQRLKAKTPVMEKAPSSSLSGEVTTSPVTNQSPSDGNADLGVRTISPPNEDSAASIVKSEVDVMQP